MNTKRSEAIIKELEHGRAMANGLAAANFAILLVITARSESTDYDFRGAYCALVGTFFAITFGLVLTGCITHRKFPVLIHKLTLPVVSLILISSLVALDAVVRPIDDNLRFVTTGLLVGGMLLIFFTHSQLKSSPRFDDEEESETTEIPKPNPSQDAKSADSA